MPKRTHNKRGAPLGNQNARKHGFYSRVLSPGQQKLLSRVAGTKGLDREIDIARVKVISALTNAPENTRVLSMALSALVRLERNRNSLERYRRKARVLTASPTLAGPCPCSDTTASHPTLALPKGKIEKGLRHVTSETSPSQIAPI